MCSIDFSFLTISLEHSTGSLALIPDYQFLLNLTWHEQAVNRFAGQFISEIEPPLLEYSRRIILESRGLHSH